MKNIRAKLNKISDELEARADSLEDRIEREVGREDGPNPQILLGMVRKQRAILTAANMLEIIDELLRF